MGESVAVILPLEAGMTEALREEPSEPEIVYPDSDDEPMAENTVQYELIVMLKGNLERELPGAFVAGDLFWYPVKGSPNIHHAPDVMVALGRPRGDRPSFMQWKEGGPPDVAIEIWSPGNTFAKRIGKGMFYDRYGVREFIAFDPDTGDLQVFLREAEGLEPVNVSEGWDSPHLGVRFEVVDGELVVTGRDGRRFRTFAEILEDEAAAAEAARQAVEAAQLAAGAARLEADAERQKADAERQKAEQAARRAALLEARLRALGIDPDAEPAGAEPGAGS